MFELILLDPPSFFGTHTRTRAYKAHINERAFTHARAHTPTCKRTHKRVHFKLPPFVTFSSDAFSMRTDVSVGVVTATLLLIEMRWVGVVYERVSKLDVCGGVFLWNVSWFV